MKQITNIRKAVCAMANELKKAGYSLSEAFRKAWQRVKLSMTVRAAGVSFENRQERLAFLQQFKPEDLTVTLEREKENKFDCNAIQIVVHIKPIRRRTVIGYVPAKLAWELEALTQSEFMEINHMTVYFMNTDREYIRHCNEEFRECCRAVTV